MSLFKQTPSTKSLGQGVELTRSTSKTSFESTRSKMSTSSRLSSFGQSIGNIFSFGKKKDLPGAPELIPGQEWRNSREATMSADMEECEKLLVSWLSRDEIDRGVNAMSWGSFPNDEAKKYDPLFHAVRQFLLAETQFLQNLPNLSAFLREWSERGCHSAAKAMACLNFIYATAQTHEQSKMLTRTCNLLRHEFCYLTDWANGCVTWEKDIQAFMAAMDMPFPAWLFHAPTRHFAMYRHTAWQLMQVGLTQTGRGGINELVHSACFAYPKETQRKFADINDPHDSLQMLEQTILTHQIKIDSCSADLHQHKENTKAIITCLTRPMPQSQMGYAARLVLDVKFPASAYRPELIQNPGQEIRMVITENAVLILSKMPNRKSDRLLFPPKHLSEVWITSHKYEDSALTTLSNKFEIWEEPTQWREIVAMRDAESKQAMVAQLRAIGLNVIESEHLNDPDAALAMLNRKIEPTTSTIKGHRLLQTVLCQEIWHFADSTDADKLETARIDFLSDVSSTTWMSPRGWSDLHLIDGDTRVSMHPTSNMHCVVNFADGRSFIVAFPKPVNATEFLEFIEARKALWEPSEVRVQLSLELQQVVEEVVQEEVQLAEEPGMDTEIQIAQPETETMELQVEEADELDVSMEQSIDMAKMEEALEDFLTIAPPLASSPDDSLHSSRSAAEVQPESIYVQESLQEAASLQLEEVQAESSHVEEQPEEPLQIETNAAETAGMAETQDKLGSVEMTPTTAVETSGPTKPVKEMSELEQKMAAVRNKLKVEESEWQERCEQLEDLLKQRDQEVIQLKREVENYKEYIIALREDKWELEQEAKVARETIARLEKMVM